ncbi:hypothetical protein CIRG_02902 [Coccidioides immitis RMSCC 2394]|uniref:Uncharacterized protein n=1 Tax=Coccidioides immitis RMSCC 2394 TaxID=404692 RepID=A0A0J6Y634_COCIT|nr:hypothetical protein CIRG_02902 [Coccidioides immitis RMSCC 2394]
MKKRKEGQDQLLRTPYEGCKFDDMRRHQAKKGWHFLKRAGLCSDPSAERKARPDRQHALDEMRWMDGWLLTRHGFTICFEKNDNPRETPVTDSAHVFHTVPSELADILRSRDGLS